MSNSTKNQSRIVNAPDRPSMMDPEVILKIQNLELRAKVIVQGFLSGLHRSPYHGFSVEFTDYRQYSPGDDLRHLDWKLVARRERYYIKRFEDETNLRCYLLVDLSKSMEFGTQAATKIEYAKTIAASLAYFMMLQRDAVGLIAFDEVITEQLPPRFRAGHLRRLMMCLERASGGTSTDLERPLEQVAATVSKRGIVVLISDWLAPVEGLLRNLSYLRSQGHEVLLIRVLDPAEVTFSFDSPSIFTDLESGKKMYVDPQTIGQDYVRRFQEHTNTIQSACNEMGVDTVQIETDQPLENALFDFLQSRSRRGRAVNRARQGAIR